MKSKPILSILSVGVLSGLLAAPAALHAASAIPPLGLTLVTAGLAAPVGLESLPDGRLFIVEQGGKIRVFKDGRLLSVPFIDISPLVESGGEKGLLGLAFHPGYASNGRFFLNYTRKDGGRLRTVVAEFGRSGANADRANPAMVRLLLTVDQPYDNHNGGQIAFGPDGYLYIGLGDGGGGGDPQGNGQDLGSLLGKMLRIDVDAAARAPLAYAIPASNPFVGKSAREEIWAYGLRNPWRFSFDSKTGDLFIGDVGQNSWEEIDMGSAGANYGWNTMEGSRGFGSADRPRAGLTLPIAEYRHDAGGGISVTGGYVYRGSAIRELEGAYIYGDYASGHVWALRRDGAGAWRNSLILDHSLRLSSFGQAANGEIYLVDYRGSVYLLVRAG